VTGRPHNLCLLLRPFFCADTSRMYSGTLINDSLATVERVSTFTNSRSHHSLFSGATQPEGEAAGLETEEFPQAFGLGSADRNLGLLLVVHPKLVRALEPGDDLANAVDVDQVGTVSAPE
jgi:hypothetical protein